MKPKRGDIVEVVYSGHSGRVTAVHPNGKVRVKLTDGEGWHKPEELVLVYRPR
jgi:hypothetical protein